jgi:Beta-propeller repeat
VVDALAGRSHYLIGEPSRWRQDVPTFGRVRYEDVYPGVSLLFYGSERQIEYDFVVAPGADPAAVVLAFDGAREVRLDDAGDLVLTTGAGELRLRRPVIYQETDGGRQPIEGGFVLDGDRVRFRVAAWDSSRPLVIDPVLGYSTYLGGASNDEGLGIAVDAAGNAYVTGTTISADFPVSSLPAGTRGGVTDAFVAKLDPTGTGLLYATYLGGSGDDIGNAIAVDTNGNAYVAGSTTSGNFPVLVAFQGTNRGLSDAFVTKLNPNGSALIYSTFLGGNDQDFAFGIAVDALGNAYVTGSTASAAFPNNGALTCLGTKSTGNDAFVAKFVPSGATLGYCRFIGGSGDDSGQAIATDAFGNVWVAGSTTSTRFSRRSAGRPTRSWAGSTRTAP